MAIHEFDVVVLGGGSGGYAAALRSAELGRSVVLIEQEKVGGTCLHRGCIPTKALLHAGEVADVARESARVGVDVALKGIDLPRVKSYMKSVIGKSWKGLEGLIRSRDIQIVHGHGELVKARTIAVGHETYIGTHVVLATGSESRSVPGVEIDGVSIIASEHALTLDQVPRKAIILGGGVIGCEFASAWTSLGSEVTIVEAMSHLVPLEDESSSRLLERAFRRRGIAHRLGSKVESVQKADGVVIVSLEDGSSVEGDLLLVAVGRSAVTQGLGFEEQGVSIDRGQILVDEYCRTSVDGVYAVGDVIPTLQLAHAGFAEGILAAEHAAGLTPAPIDYDGVPRITYSSPEVASVGLTEKDAVSRFGPEDVRTVTYDLSGNGRSAILGTQGAVKLVARGDGQVIGTHIVGDRVGELIAEAQLIYNWEAHADDVAPLLHPHPTQSEAIGEAHMLLAGKPLHVH